MADKADTWKLVRDLNRHLQSGAHDVMLLERNYDAKWPELKQTLDAVLAEYKESCVHEVPESETVRAVYQLSPEAIKLLARAAADRQGTIFVLRTLAGIHLEVGNQLFAHARCLPWKWSSGRGP